MMVRVWSEQIDFQVNKYQFTSLNGQVQVNSYVYTIFQSLAISNFKKGKYKREKEIIKLIKSLITVSLWIIKRKIMFLLQYPVT